MDIKNVYEKYLVPGNLQEHMLRVAAVAKLVVDGWDGKEVDKESIIQTCLLHDVAKPISFDPDKQAKFGMSEEDINRLKQYQSEMKTKYGESEHEILAGILDEVGVTVGVKRLALALEWSDIPRYLEAQDKETLVPIYADMRVGMKGILPIIERVAELRGRASFVGSESMDNWARQLEDKLQLATNTKLQEITDDVAAPIIVQLQNYQI